MSLQYLYLLRYHMSGDVGSLTVEIIPLLSNGLNDTSVFSIQGDQGREWKRSPDIAISDCNDYKVGMSINAQGSRR